MRRYLAPVATVIATIALAAPVGADEWWDVPTDSDTGAEVRAVLVPRLEDHRADVARVRRERRERAAELAALAAAADAAANAVAEAQATYDTTRTYGCLSADAVAGYARGAGFPESAIPTMVAYADRESGFCPGAINASSGACGLWQLYPCYGGAAWLDPATNAALAYDKYAASGFAPWGG